MTGLEGLLHSLPKRKHFRAKRISSYDTTGGNQDYWPIEAGETKGLAELDGPGCISHIWATIGSPDDLYLRKLLLRMYWDGERYPSVEVPIGDFFGLGHARTYSYQCAFFNTSSRMEGQLGGGCAMNCWIPMPFGKNARLEVVNEQEQEVKAFYFYVDYQLFDGSDDDLMRFHALWRRENPCDGWTGKGSVWHNGEWGNRMQGDEGKNLDGKGNYVILDAEGSGHYIGVNFSIDHLYKGWYGEGDDMFFIDGEKWPPSLHGTGTEDYLSHAWGMQRNSHLYNGQAWAEMEDFNNWGKVCVYRYHVVDPVPFEKSILVSIEHGHANNRSDDYSSCTYWYQNEPHKRLAPVPSVEARLPNL